MEIAALGHCGAGLALLDLLLAAERLIAAGLRAGLAFIAAGDGGVADVVTTGEIDEIAGHVSEALGDDVNDHSFDLQLAADRHEPRVEDGPAVAFEYPGPDDDVGDAGFVFDGGKDDAARGAGALADEHEASHFDALAVAMADKIRTFRDAEPVEAG